MDQKKVVYFVSLSSNVPYVLKKALQMVEQNYEVAIFFDLDGARVLDKRYLNFIDRTHGTDLASLIKFSLDVGVQLFGCQMNVLMEDGLELIEGAELAGVVTFLDIAYQADAVLSF
ncbi:DsrE family protein [Halobacillus sp. BBL2006]|uniref:DsrE family protein n=1 Tax=Halobacillus sp. BBL2006 TaxID=1543706 RepID=UPI0005422EDE|nr:DsrE family protein [Halobacillus sp. BBL2006]KHE72774.1 peroxiredoxin DrsE family protein [Halobacillus sp. BBL2006]